LETAVLNELERRGAEVGYVKTEEGYEVDFHARLPDRRSLLVQACADASAPDVLNRELRALSSAARKYPRAERVLIVLTREQAAAVSEAGVNVYPAHEWFLEEPAR
jgi:predicted AAA+ superfamily ATPase